MTQQSIPTQEDIAEIIISHFPNASRSVMQEMQEELQVLINDYIKQETTEARIEELERVFVDFDERKLRVIEGHTTLASIDDRIKRLRAGLESEGR